MEKFMQIRKAVATWEAQRGKRPDRILLPGWFWKQIENEPCLSG